MATGCSGSDEETSETTQSSMATTTETSGFTTVAETTTGTDGITTVEPTDTMADPECGNGIVENGEDCDDGNADNTDACTDICTAAACGDGYVQEGEACDDGNADNTDECTDACALASCGDGFVQGDEACDDGNADNTDACTELCMPPACGDGYVQDGEDCDDGNDLDDDACIACVAAACGDGYVQEGIEGCDDGNDVDDDACSNTCASASCGDGVVQAGEGESCDDANDVDTDMCTSACQEAACGDGFVYEGVEDCDAAGESAECNDDCTPAACGDGILNQSAGEECDDGDDDDTDECTGLCTLPVCGDGFVQEGEQCDDGNLDPGDGCDDKCIAENCFKFSNDGAENLLDNTWFDACIDAVGTKVHVILRDNNNNVVYEASGSKVGDWTYDQITSTTAVNSQYHSSNHNRLVSLDSGDKLMIAGRNAANSGCGGSFGNGYGIVIYPANPNYYSNVKLMAMPYKQYVAPYQGNRGFSGWSQAAEISYNGGSTFNTCNGVVPFTGSFEVRIEP